VKHIFIGIRFEIFPGRLFQISDILFNLSIHFIMFINLFKHSLRSITRHRAYIIINVLGLSIGIACSLFIAFFVINEASYDKFNTKKDSIFRVILNANFAGKESKIFASPAVFGPTLQKEFPEIEGFLRMHRVYPLDITCNNQTFTEDHLVETDSSFFDFFSVRVLKGDLKNLLNSPHKVVLSSSTAKKYFGDENPIDKILKIGSDTVGYSVAGVMADIPENSHFEANMISSFMTNPESNDQIWLSASFSTYLLLKPNSSYISVDKKFPELVNKHIGPEIQKYLGMSLTDFTAKGNAWSFHLQNLKDIHLDPSIQQEFKEAGDPKYLKILGSLAILIVIIAAINFMNLSTAQASRRAKEVGIKKVGGSTRSMLILQFLTESFILSFISLIIGLIIIKVTLPYFNNLISAKLAPDLFANWYTIPGLILFTMVVGFLSGSYPAFYLSSFNPYEVLKGIVKKSTHTGLLRRVLVVFQFTVSILLIVGTIIMFRQINYMMNKDLGFNKEQILVIDKAGDLGTKINSFKETVTGIPGVIHIVSSTAVPGRNNRTASCKMEGGANKLLDFETNFIDYDYLDTYGITLTSGRTFNKSFTTDQQACIINESAVKNFGITNLEETRFTRPGDPTGTNYLQVIGVVKNFNFKSLHNQIDPYLFCLKTDDISGGYLSVKLSVQNYTKTISSIESKWKEFTGNKPLEYYFVDKDFEQMYISEKQNATMAVIFSVLAIFIASLGLFGLTSFTVEQRTKEIGVRKAMGSSVTGVYTVISKEVIILVSVSALIAWPIIYFVGGKWLESFYYKIPLSPLSFIAGFAIALGIAILTISYRILRAASINPAQSLKYE
jgi:putative ABC transport system permease protein